MFLQHLRGYAATRSWHQYELSLNEHLLPFWCDIWEGYHNFKSVSHWLTSHGLDGMKHSGHFLFILCYFTGFYTVSDLAVIHKNTRQSQLCTSDSLNLECRVQQLEWNYENPLQKLWILLHFEFLCNFISTWYSMHSQRLGLIISIAHSRIGWINPVIVSPTIKKWLDWKP